MVLSTTRFLLKLGHFPARPTRVRSGLCTAWIYGQPRSPRGTILSIHGANRFGPLDPRWVQLSRGLAEAGFIVAAPHVPSIASLAFCPDQIEQLVDIIEELLEDPTLCPAGRAGLLSVSLSGGLTLQAAAQPRLRDRISAILTIGAYAETERTADHMVRHPEADLYGALLLFANYYRHRDPTSRLPEAFTRLALDNFHRRPLNLARARAILTEADGRLLEAMLSSPQVRGDVWDTLRAHIKGELRRLDTIPHLQGLRAPVTVIHGEGDDVIPPSEADALAEALDATGRLADKVITPLLSHGDTQRRWSTLLREAPPLIRAFGGWMRAITQPA
ncbi:MAG: alpha/beta hydrolase [Myxococcota bacterium]